jgi:exodeoxyribonuclease V alpha subunit
LASGAIMSSDQHQLSAIVARITFHNEENGFSVLKVKVANQKALVTVVGSVLGVQSGVTIRCTGHWHIDRQYGQRMVTPDCTPKTEPTTVTKAFWLATFTFNTEKPFSSL